MRPCECGCADPPVVAFHGVYHVMAEVRCTECGLTTGLCMSLAEAKDHWDRGDVAAFHDWMVELADER